MKLYNTMTRTIEEFEPQNEVATMYTCGPTVYAPAHIGNLRSYLFEDFLRRTLEFSGTKVDQVMNITDVDDKTIRRSEGNKEKLLEITHNVEMDFLHDLMKLNILTSRLTRATEYIDQMVALVKDLLEKGYAYKAEDGSTYFSVDKFPEYGKLSRLDKSGMRPGARVSQDEYDKENPADFVLWKAWTPEDGDVYWDTELGRGRPGWHIECSAMAQDALGDTIDIHAAGVDLVFPHHENEIAQSEASTGKPFARFWVHGEHLMIDNQKMSKSLNNLYTLANLEEKGFSALDFRYLVLGAHYRTRMNFTWESLSAAKNSRVRLNRIISALPEEGTINEKYLSLFKEKLSNDLDTPGALAVLWELVRDEAVSPEEKRATALIMDEIFMLNLGEKEEHLITDEIIALAEKRKEARINKDYAASDKLRIELESQGYIVEDLPQNEYKIIKSS